MKSDSLYPHLEDTLSAERFATYLAWAGGHREPAIELYSSNARLSEALYIPLQMLEVALRNRIHAVMCQAQGETWFDAPEYQMNPWQNQMLQKAKKDLNEAGKEITAGAVVAGLTFGFWTAMVGREYENLWQTTLKGIARREDGKGLQRKAFAAPLAPIRTLRNRVAHHEPILHWNLPKHYAAILQLTTWLSPVAAEWCRALSRFELLHPEAGFQLVRGHLAG